MKSKEKFEGYYLFIWSAVEDHNLFEFIDCNSEINDNDAPRKLYYEVCIVNKKEFAFTRADSHIVHCSLSESLTFSFGKDFGECQW